MYNCPDSYHGLRDSVADRQKPRTAPKPTAPATPPPATASLHILTALRRLSRRDKARQGAG